MTSSVSICSNALLRVGAGTISSLEEANDRARLCANLYPQARDAMLRAHPWNCAVTRVVLAPESTAPAFDYAYQFTIPGDMLRILSVGLEGYAEDYQIEGNRILANTAAVYLRYIRRNETESSWDALLIEAVTAEMAALIAYPLTKSATLQQTMVGLARAALQRARTVDGQDNPPETFGDFPLLAARAGRF